MAFRRLLAEKTRQSEFRGAIHGVTQNMNPIFFLTSFLGWGGVSRDMEDLEGVGVIKL